MKTRIQILLLTLLFTSFLGYSQDWEQLEYKEHQRNIEHNPLKGFILSTLNRIDNTQKGVNPDLPVSLVKLYIPMREIWKENGFNWHYLDSLLNKAAEHGLHAIPRMTYHDPDTSGGAHNHTPDHLIGNGPNQIEQQTDDGGHIQPVWNDPDLIDDMVQFIAAYGARYGQDIRIPYIDIGLIGRWGEGNYHNKNLEPMNQENIDRIIRAYFTHFPDKIIMGRKPDYFPTVKVPGTNDMCKDKIGYYDDSFGRNTVDMGNSFLTKLENAEVDNNWKSYPIGGEVNPSVDEDDLAAVSDYLHHEPDQEKYIDQNFKDCITRTHASWITNTGLFVWDWGRNEHRLAADHEINNIIGYHKMMGYRLHVKEVRLSPHNTNKVKVDLKIRNKGVAPFYFKWNVQIAAQNINNEDDFRIIKTTGSNHNFDIRKVKALDVYNQGEPEIYQQNITTNSLPDYGRYKILMRLVNPLESISDKARKLRFANRTQDADRNGWLTLGEYEYKEDSVSSNTGDNTDCNLDYTDSKTYTNPNQGKHTIYSQVVNISCASDGVKIFADVSGGPGLEPHDESGADYIKFYYKKNGNLTKFKEISDKKGSFDKRTVESGRIEGESIELIIETYTTADREKYVVNNIRVEKVAGSTTTCNDDFPWSHNSNNIEVIKTNELKDYIISNIDISCATNVYLHAEIEGGGGLEGNDGLKIEYALNNGSWRTVKIYNISNDFNDNLSFSIPNGNNVKLKINSSVSWDREYIRIKNLRLNDNSTSKAAIDKNSEIDNVENEKISMYPNPVKDLLHINVPTETYTMSLANMFGKTVLQKTNLKGRNSINVARFNAGMYFVKINTKTTQTVKKVIIQ